MAYDLKELQACQLDILKELTRVCEKNGITFFLVYGTCLGAVRHKGFIPWDDDIDVGMTVADFEKLKACKDEFQEKYFLQTRETDAGYGLMIGRLRNSETTLIEADESYRDMNHGVFIDIYPFFNCPTKKFARKRMVFHSMLYRLMLYQKAPKNRGKMMRIGSKVLLALCPKFLRRAIMKHSEKVLYSYKETGFYSPFYGGLEKKTYAKEMLFPVRKAPFEDTVTYIPAQAEKYLELTYGNYMQLPPEEKRVIHHDFKCVDLENGYLKYKGEYYCVDGDKK
ncbi:MAG: LicD family protein [Clostridia bacterium]|nr:LicD family protein [Clostridia bacterium]